MCFVQTENVFLEPSYSILHWPVRLGHNMGYSLCQGSGETPISNSQEVEVREWI